MYKAQYEGTFTIEVSEEEAREAYQDNADDLGWDGPFYDHVNDAAEAAARKKLINFIRSSPEDIELHSEPCAGVWEQEKDE